MVRTIEKTQITVMQRKRNQATNPVNDDRQPAYQAYSSAEFWARQRQNYRRTA